MWARFKFVESPYFVGEPGNWHLLEGASEEDKAEFQMYIEYQEARSMPFHQIELTEKEMAEIKKKMKL